jgi:hypothetical protein
MSQSPDNYPQGSYQPPKNKKTRWPRWALALIIFVDISLPLTLIVAYVNAENSSKEHFLISEMGSFVQSLKPAVAILQQTYTGSNEVSISLECTIQYLNAIGNSSAGYNRKFIVATLVMTNLSNKTIFVNPADFVLHTTGGLFFRFDQSSLELKPHLEQAQIVPGGKLSGGISFKVPKDLVPTDLRWLSYQASEIVVRFDQ